MDLPLSETVCIAVHSWHARDFSESFPKLGRNGSIQGQSIELTSREWIGAKQGAFGPELPMLHT